MRRRLLYAGLGTLLAVAAYLVASLASHGTAERPRYVALGDSFSSGNGTFTSTGECNRSADAYPALLAADMGWPDWAHEACSGATTDDMLGRQLGHLTDATKVVTVTIGGNDTGFVHVLTACVLYDVAGCARTIDQRRQLMHQFLPTTLERAYRSIRTRAPNAMLIVVGYPHIFDIPNTCGPLDTHPGNQALLNGFTDELDETIKSAALRAAARFIDVRAAFTGHGICAAEPYINGFATDIRGAYHPTKAGHQRGYLATIRQGLDA